jgi:GAF domain-containing protein
VGSAIDLPEGLRLICRELARLTGAETASAHLLDARTGLLRPIAAHGVPKHAVEALAAGTLAHADLAGLQEVFGRGHVIWSDDASNDARFEAGLFHRVPHQSALVIPLVFDGEVAGAFFLVWWSCDAGSPRRAGAARGDR